ncbi:MAG TPA: hypothetical protein VF529_09540 [Solirubrobacteraceae bacterium]|jgi:hypothetical protein
MADFVTPTEMARELGVEAEAVRSWLRGRRDRGDRRLADQEPGRAWRLDPGQAWDLIREFAVERLGQTVEDVWGPHAWLNWHAFTAGRPKRTSPRTSTSLVLPTWQEYAVYSDAPARGELRLGPYRFINTLAEERGVGSAALRLVIRADDHLGEPDYTTPIDEEDVTAWVGGDLSDELAAVLSLALARRMRSGGVTREGWANGDPVGTPIEGKHDPPVLIPPRGAPMLPRVAEVMSLQDAEPFLEQYRRLGQDDAVAVARAARQFADALWLADADARLSWIKLVGAVETAANRWDAAKETSPVALLRRHRKRVYNAIKDCGEDVVLRVAKDLAGTFKATDKFKGFLLEFDPGPPKDRPDVGRFDWSGLADALDWVYTHRSRDLHAGIAFPAPLCEPPAAGAGPPHETFPAIAAEAGGGRWMAEQLPLYLHVFVYVAGDAIRRWWMALPAGAPAER